MHIGNSRQIGIIKNTLMGLTVTPHQPCTIYSKHYRQILNTHIMQDLIVGSL